MADSAEKAVVKQSLVIPQLRLETNDRQTEVVQ